jgi:hypothetical protein
LKEAKVTSMGLNHIGFLKNLRSLKLCELPNVSEGSLKFLSDLPQLKVLEIAQVTVSRSDLAAVSSMPTVERLLLWNISADSNSELEIDHLGGLRSLRVLRTNLPVLRSALIDLSKIRSLEAITDELTLITDEELAGLATLPKLHTLCLGSDQITAKSLPTLARMSALRSLFVTDRVRLTCLQLSELGRNSLPDCQIQLFYPPYTIFHQPTSR